jgi:hypothetical protein
MMEQFTISDTKIVQAKLFRSKLYVDIRKWEQVGTTKKPTLVGITLFRVEYDKLKSLVGEIKAIIAVLGEKNSGATAIFLSSGKILQIKVYDSEVFIDIRKFDKVPLEIGITLNAEEFDCLADLMDEIDHALCELDASSDSDPPPSFFMDPTAIPAIQGGSGPLGAACSSPIDVPVPFKKRNFGNKLL